MSSPTSNSRAPRGATLALCAAAASLGACSLARKEPPPAPHPVVTVPSAAPVATGAVPAAAATGAASVPGAAAPAAVRPEVPPAARADFTRGVTLMRAGNTIDAELTFRQIALQYPQFAAPLVNVGLMQRKQGQLEKAEESLKSAVAREDGSAVAWTELGVTQRMRGEFKDAAGSYQKAVEVDPLYAPAWRNLGVLEDLYLGDPARALPAFEEYKKLTGEEKPVSGWIADLRQRLGIKRPEAAAPAPENAAAPADPGAAAPPPAPEPAPGAAPKTGG